MIRSIADLLEKIKEKEVKVLEKYLEIKNPVMIGNMYEGLTKSLTNNTLFDGLNLKVVSGKFKNKEGKYSAQIDCMIVQGEGEHIPYTEDYIYDADKVLVVIQVKKNLFSKELKESHEHFINIYNTSDSKYIRVALVRDAYRGIVKEELPSKDSLKNISKEKLMLYDYLFAEAMLPVRIVFGYDGFSSETSLRDAFEEYIKTSIGDMPKLMTGFSPCELPNLIICNSNSLIKLNGMPYYLYSESFHRYQLFASYSQNPILLMLELIWTKLIYLFKIRAVDLFGEDLTVQVLNPFMEFNIENYDGKCGFGYGFHKYSADHINSGLKERDWNPIFIDQYEATLFMGLGAYGEIDIQSLDFIEYLEKNNSNVKEFVEKFCNARIIYLENDRYIKYLTDECTCVITSNGDFVVADNKDGRLLNWVRKQV